ncbi:protein D2-like [Planococcus citri]|uniref:protein D2-like n=1 Tax=Planococcus citri TaxID=170843 RepID=UPI0031F778E3
MFHRLLLFATIFQLINSQYDKEKDECRNSSETCTPNPDDIIDTQEDLPWEERVNMATRFFNHKLVPDLIGLPPRSRCHAWFPGLLKPARVVVGGELARRDLFYPPHNMSWKYIPDHLYTVFLTTPDFTTTTNFTNWRQLHHLLLINVKNCYIDTGDIVLDYLIPQIVRAAGYTRYAFLVYEQPDRIPVPQIKRNGLNATFTLKQFVQKHNLGNPKFGNYFFIYYE